MKDFINIKVLEETICKFFLESQIGKDNYDTTSKEKLDKKTNQAKMLTTNNIKA